MSQTNQRHNSKEIVKKKKCEIVKTKKNGDRRDAAFPGTTVTVCIVPERNRGNKKGDNMRFCCNV